MRRLAITTGEPAGIGVDLAVELSQRDWDEQLIILVDPELLAKRAQQLDKPLEIILWNHQQTFSSSRKGQAFVCAVPLAENCITGKLNPANAHYVLQLLQTAIDGIADGEFDALITGPVHKGIINEAGINFTGHTEWFAEKAGNIPVVMMLACDQLKVALATTHLPLRDIADAITSTSLTTTLSILHESLRRDFGISEPNILVTGLNPHAGEGGHLGMEEIEVIQPVCRWAQAQGWQVSDPMSADTLFSPKNMATTHAFLAMYHDQGLTVLKHACFGKAVNITLGLPYIRTSVDHGTALELAGTGKAEVSSFIYAIETAISMVHHRFG